MNAVKEQQDILAKLAQLISDNADSGYSTATCVFDFEEDLDGSYAIGEQFAYVVEGREVSTYLVDPDREVSLLVPKLHKLMKEHTGGSWSEMTLTLASDGQLKTEFKYPDAS